MSIHMGSGQLGKRWALPPGKESSTCTGTWNSIRDPPADSKPTSARKTRVNLEETETSNLPPRRNRDLSYCSCPSSIPSSCLYPHLPLRTSLSGQECGWSSANGCCLMIWVLTEGGRGGRFWWTVPALRWLRVSSCQVSWGNPSVPFVTSFYHSVILTRSLSTLFQWIERRLVPEMILNIHWLCFLPKHLEISNIVQFATYMTMNWSPSYIVSTNQWGQ